MTDMGRRCIVTERTLYPAIKRVFNEYGAKVIIEPSYRVTMPDLLVEWLGEKWIISVKIGDPNKPRLLREAFMQYMNHVANVGTTYGMVMFYPESVRKLECSEEVIEEAVRTTNAYFVVFKPQMELRKPLPAALHEIMEVLRKKVRTTFTLKTVVKLLKEHIEELMDRIHITELQVAKFITDPELFFGISQKEKKEKRDKRREYQEKLKISQFLAAYIFLSQVLFLRLYSSTRPLFMEDVDPLRVSREDAKRLFNKIKKINYEPIFEIDTLNLVPEEYIRDTFKLIWGLQIENIRFELPGRLFHELMPEKIRKLLAAFYTRPIAAYLLAQLTIDDPDATVFDPACGSGTILTAAYRRKLELWQQAGRKENPHKRFCEEQIYGCDIMPFAVHLTNANLAAMDPTETIYRTLIALGDSLKLSPEQRIRPGFKTLLDFMKWEEENKNSKVEGYTRTGKPIKFRLKPVKVVLMNPPFTKVERGIEKYIDLDRFKDRVGGEVGLWGHFVALADLFLEEGGIFGAVIPINLLRGRESKKVREIIFSEWLPLYIIKPTRNYGFSEWAEYRDILVIAKKVKEKPAKHRVKFCLIKKDLHELTEEEAKQIAEWIKEVDYLRSDLLDINSHTLEEVKAHFDNMMPLISGPSFKGKDALLNIIEKADKVLCLFPRKYFREAYGPRPAGVSKFMFVTNPVGPGRIKEAFLILEKDLGDKIVAKTLVGVKKFEFRKKHFLPSLRTPVDLTKMDVTGTVDYVAKEPYERLSEVMELAGFNRELPENYWEGVRAELRRSKTHVAVVRRINPFSPNQRLIAFFSEEPIYPACVFHATAEMDPEWGKAITVLLNSIFFLANFFNLKEESTGRYIDVRQHDLYRMRLYPCNEEQVRKLAEIYEKYKDIEFPSLSEQLDVHFEERYNQFWLEERKGQSTLTPLPPLTPHKDRIEFDMAVARAIGITLTREELLAAYEAIVEDMIITRGLRKD